LRIPNNSFSRTLFLLCSLFLIALGLFYDPKKASLLKSTKETAAHPNKKASYLFELA
jgi:hypothetical protein